MDLNLTDPIDLPIDTAPNTTTVEWTPEHEGILIEWADKAMCYR